MNYLLIGGVNAGRIVNVEPAHDFLKMVIEPKEQPAPSLEQSLDPCDLRFEEEAYRKFTFYNKNCYVHEDLYRDMDALFTELFSGYLAGKGVNNEASNQ